MQLIDELTEKNFELYAAKHYNNPRCLDIQEFYDDLLKFIQLNFTINDSTAKEIIKRWFEKTTDEKVSKVEFWMSGD